MQKKVDEEKDRLSAYVTSDTTKMINDFKDKYRAETGLKLTIGQAVDFLVKKATES